jgi:hypothetical protein
MRFSSYKVNMKHRTGLPRENASMWAVSDWTEIELFVKAKSNEWRSPDKELLWSVSRDERGLTVIGHDPDNELYIAKFVHDLNQEWHGYPVLPKGADRPPQCVMDLWLGAGIINKLDKKRLMNGSF